ncbi:MAG: DUF7344 domain-containing protein [Halovenus sp.]
MSTDADGVEDIVAQVGPDEQRDPTPKEIAIDTVTQLLSCSRRREAVSYLAFAAGEEGATIGELADHIAALEVDKPIRDITSEERKRVYVALYQTHLKKLDDAGVVNYDGDRKRVTLGPNSDEFLELVKDLRLRFSAGGFGGEEDAE